MDGNDALAALFAAATASVASKQQQRPMELPITPIKPTAMLRSTRKAIGEKPCKSQNIQQAQKMSAASNLIASLLNGSLNSSSLPPTKTTATLTTTTARPCSGGQRKVTSTPKKAAQSQRDQRPPSSEIATNKIEPRKLELWFDEDAEKLDESQYQELADSCETNGWSADEMFKYNEKRHKIMSSFNHRTINQGYTTPLPKNRSKLSLSMAKKVAAEIEERAKTIGGRVTPESSDDDEMFELERRRRIQLKQQKQLDQLKILNSSSSFGDKRISNHSQKRRSSETKMESNNKQDYRSPMIGSHYQTTSARRTGKPCSQLSDSSVTPPATISSTSSSPKPSDSSSAIMNMSSQTTVSTTKSSKRNIFRTSLS